MNEEDLIFVNVLRGQGMGRFVEISGQVDQIPLTQGFPGDSIWKRLVETNKDIDDTYVKISEDGTFVEKVKYENGYLYIKAIQYEAYNCS